MTSSILLFLPLFFSVVPTLSYPVYEQSLFEIKAWTRRPPHPLSAEWSWVSSEEGFHWQVTGHVICQLSEAKEKGKMHLYNGLEEYCPDSVCINIVSGFFYRDKESLHMELSNRSAQSLSLQHSKYLLMLNKRAVLEYKSVYQSFPLACLMHYFQGPLFQQWNWKRGGQWKKCCN